LSLNNVLFLREGDMDSPLYKENNMYEQMKSGHVSIGRSLRDFIYYRVMVNKTA